MCELVWTRTLSILTPFQVSTNGALSFGERLQSYSGDHLSMVNTALIAPFWADADTRESGEVFYRQTNESSCITNVTNILREVFEDAVGFTPFTLFIATWNNVGYYNRNRDRVSKILLKQGQQTQQTRFSTCTNLYILGG